MKYTFHAEALVEFRQAVLYYNNEPNSQLAAEFYSEINDLISKVVRNPYLFMQIAKGVRRCLSHRFPYAVFYTIKADHIFIVAVLHSSRHPDTWRGRV